MNLLLLPPSLSCFHHIKVWLHSKQLKTKTFLMYLFLGRSIHQFNSWCCYFLEKEGISYVLYSNRAMFSNQYSLNIMKSIALKSKSKVISGLYLGHWLVIIKIARKKQNLCVIQVARCGRCRLMNYMTKYSSLDTVSRKACTKSLVLWITSKFVHLF